MGATETKLAGLVKTNEIGTGDLDVTLVGEDACRLISQLEAALARAREDALRAEERAQEAEKENQHLKIAVEELQIKLKNFVKQAEESEDPKIRKLIEDTGFNAILNSKSVWDRLYDEAMERIQRMKLLRANYKAKTNVDEFTY